MRSAILGVLALGAIPGVARGQDSGFNAHGFNLAAFDADVRDPLTVQRPGAVHQNEWFLGGLLEYASQPLVYQTTDASGADVGDPTVVLDNLFALNTSVGWAPVDRIRVDAALPLFFTSTGQDGPEGVGVGDARFTGMVAILEPDDDDGGLGLGVFPYLDVPTGNDANFLGQAAVSGGAKAAATYELAHFTLGGELGAYFGRNVSLANLPGSDSLTTGLAVGFNPAEDLGFTLETHLLSPFTSSPEAGTGSPSEVLLSGRKTTESGAHLVAGLATAVTRGASAAQYRLFLGGGYGHVHVVKDTDGDGLLDPADACVTEPETKNGYKDEDGCPDGPGKVEVVVLQDGKPVSGASLTVQAADGQPAQATSGAEPWSVESFPERVWRATANKGTCLGGSGEVVAGEGTTRLEVPLKPEMTSTIQVEVVDPKGAAIDKASIRFAPEPDGCVPATATDSVGGHSSTEVGAGTHELRVSAPGYAIHTEPVVVQRGETKVVHVVLNPTKVQVTEKQIVILDVVYFETAKAIIKPESFGLLDEVATTIRTNPQLGRVEVSGHTDSQGSDSANLLLSQHRAESVRDYLVKQGVDASLLVAKGYGETKPIAPNTTAAGRAKNRRVEFNLIDKQATGTPTWGPANPAPAPAPGTSTPPK